MVNRVGARQVFEANKHVFSTLGRLGKLNVKVRQAFDDAKGMQRIFDKAKALKTVDEAIDRLNQRLKDKGGLKTGNLNSFRLIMDEVQRAEPPRNLGDNDFFAVHHEVWKKSVEAGREKPIFLLKRRGGYRGRDGTRALRSDLDKMAKAGDWVRYARAVNLTALLDDFKNLQPHGKKRLRLLEENSDALKDLALCLPVDFYNRIKAAQSPSDVANAFMVAYKKHREISKNSNDTFYDFLGKTATKFIHPRLETVLEAARQCPSGKDSGMVGSVLDPHYLLKLFDDFFYVLSSDEVWSHPDVVSHDFDYYGAGLSLAVLQRFGEKTSFTQDDIALLRSTLKDAPYGEDEDSIERREKKAIVLDALNDIDLKAKPWDIHFKMSIIVVQHYIKHDVLNLAQNDKTKVLAAISKAREVKDVIKALETAFVTAAKGFEKEQLLKPLEELVARHGAT